MAKSSRDNQEIGRLLALAAVCDGMSRGGAAQTVGMDRQTLRDWAVTLQGGGTRGASAIACVWTVGAA